MRRRIVFIVLVTLAIAIASLRADVTRVPRDYFFGSIGLDRTTTTPGVTGNITINKIAGTANVAAAAATLTVTNSNVATTSYVFCSEMTNDSTCLLKACVPGAGSFVVRMSAACNAETAIAFLILN